MRSNQRLEHCRVPDLLQCLQRSLWREAQRCAGRRHIRTITITGTSPSATVTQSTATALISGGTMDGNEVTGVGTSTVSNCPNAGDGSINLG